MTMTAKEAVTLMNKATLKAMAHPYENPSAGEATRNASRQKVAEADVATMRMALGEAERLLDKGRHDEAILAVLAHGIFTISQSPVLLEAGHVEARQVQGVVDNGVSGG